MLFTHVLEHAPLRHADLLLNAFKLHSNAILTISCHTAALQHCSTAHCGTAALQHCNTAHCGTAALRHLSPIVTSNRCHQWPPPSAIPDCKAKTQKVSRIRDSVPHTRHDTN
eukprot:354083-Chlamydomonas_euryale.AAC.4